MQLQRRVLNTHRPTARVEPSAPAVAIPHPTVSADSLAPRKSGLLADLLAARCGEVAQAVGDAVAAHLGEYGGIGGEVARALITTTFETLIKSAATGEPYSQRELDRFRGMGARAVHWKLRLPDLRTAFNVALAAAHRELWTMAPPEDFVEMAQVTARCARMAELAREACLEGFTSPGTQDAYARMARTLLAEHLIAGDWSADPTRLHAIAPDVAPGYLVLVCESGIDPGGPAWAKVEEDLARRRGVLYLGDPLLLTVLFPSENEEDALHATHCAADVVEKISGLADGAVYATQAYRPGLADLPAAVAEARRMLSLVKAIPDAQVRPYRSDDLLVELALLHQPSIRHRLAGLIEPLDAGTGLRRTLEVVLACNLDRERAATELCIHRRTLYYRMDRIRKLSGIDPNTAHGIQLLRAALTCARMQETSTHAER